MYQKAFLFNGIGSKPEKLLVKLSPALTEKYQYYVDEEFSRLGLQTALENNLPFDRKVAEWIISLICDRVVFEYYLSQGIVPDIGAGYSSGIVSISACFGAVPHTFAHEIIMMNRATMRTLEQHHQNLDMGVILGLDYQSVQDILQGRFTPEEVMVGSANSIICTMITGQAEAVEKALAICMEEGAMKAIRFHTGIAYHHPCMKQYSQEYNDFCGSIAYQNPEYPIISVFDNRIMTEGTEIMRENQLNVYTPIRWDLALKKLTDLGVTEFFDVSANGAVEKFSRINKRKGRIYTLSEL
ncbi:MAG: ACP S-malonyltransferase [Oscillospiraceae bacterium]|nr:ACP S-malonyltransferase [Oscillospiraceae bacterium]